VLEYYNFYSYVGKVIYFDCINIYKFIENKNIVIINNLGILMKKQYESGNAQKVYEKFPLVKNIDYIEPYYTFFNNGPHESILESIENIYRKIDEKINDTYAFVISSGAYSVLLANYIFSKYKKEVLIIGGTLPYYFAIHTNRDKLLDNNTFQHLKE
jgi:hypothetical protein